MPKVVAFLPAKGSSERIPSKNLALLDGKPLFLHTLEKLCTCDFIDEVYLDSESDEILNYAPYLGYIPLRREPALATNHTDGHQMFYNEVGQVKADIYIQILGTSPFIQKDTLHRGVRVLLEQPEYDSVVLVRRDKQYLWSEAGPLYDQEHIPNSVDLPDTIIEAMGLYMVRRECALREKKRYGGRCWLLNAQPLEAVDINTPADFALAELTAKGLRAKEAARLRTLGRALSSPVLSDLLDAHGVHSVIAGLSPNDPGAKILARANTLRLRKRGPGEDTRGIYDALGTYARIGEGEVIVVENEVPHRAYFGELNANLAVRSGASAAIIGGVTRDAAEVRALGFQVFSSGLCCADVRGAAVMDSHNQPIHIQGVRIAPGDLVFADCNGIVVIPRHLEKVVLGEALAAIKKEKSVLGKIYMDEDAHSIFEKEGAF